VIATRNRGKYREIADLLRGLQVGLVPLDRAGPIEVPPESGHSFQENARQKAVVVAAAARQFALADDSGLEVDALGGQPGVRSARFGPPGASDAERNRLLLDRLRGVPVEGRAARFRCAVAIADPRGGVWEAEGVCEGRIALVARGANGFGYDPVFEVPSLGMTLAEVDLATKNRLSHRGRALVAARGILEGILGRRS
jgi:XTP/dITP diphosphohydrolase